MTTQNKTTQKRANETHDTFETLTSYPLGSLRELWTLSYPLMLSGLSGTLMLFLDRLILASYQTDAMNAAATASCIFFALLFGSVSITAIAEVFVGQHNGAKRYREIGQPVWAMIWFSLFLTIPFILFAVFASEHLLPEAIREHGVPYLSWLIATMSAFPLVAALSSFFIGRGEVAVVTYSVALGNALNLILNILFVFGIEGWIPSMGAKGSAIATGISQWIIAGLLFALFLQKKYRDKYYTHHWHFKMKPFMDCVRIGFPNSIGHMIALAAWTGVMILLEETSFEHITVFAICQGIWILFSFAIDASSKAVSAVTSNLIGARMQHMIPKILKSGIVLQSLYSLVLIVPLLILPGLLVERFLPTDLTGSEYDLLVGLAKAGCHWIWIAFFFDAITWVIAGVLTSAGDTMFIMYMSAIGSWAFGIVPTYFLVVKHHGGPDLTMMIITFFTLMMSVCFYFRYRSNHWQKKIVTQQLAMT